MSGKDRIPVNLVALGSAAVMTVYAAGFARTQPAAQQLAEADERRPVPPIPVKMPVVEQPAAPVVAAPAPPPVKKKKAAEGRVVAVDTTHATPVVPAAPAPAAPLTPVTPVLVDTVKTPPAVVAAVDSAKADEPIHYKDGVYFGWGTSRHGDIQMGIEIKDGRIKSAFISECNTQYDCSWIYHLPKQVVQRQSADVDFVSGATHSANALYRAVVNALKQAQTK